MLTDIIVAMYHIYKLLPHSIKCNFKLRTHEGAKDGNKLALLTKRKEEQYLTKIILKESHFMNLASIYGKNQISHSLLSVTSLGEQILNSLTCTKVFHGNAVSSDNFEGWGWGVWLNINGIL